MRTVPAGEFKAKCLAIMDQLKATGEPVLVTRRGKPLAKVSLPDEETSHVSPESIFGFLRGMGTIVGDPDDLVGPIIPLEDWDHLRDDWSLCPPK